MTALKSYCATEIERDGEQELPAAGQPEHGQLNGQLMSTEEYQEVQQANHLALQPMRDQDQPQRQTGRDDGTSQPGQHSKRAVPQVGDAETQSNLQQLGLLRGVQGSYP